jgi:REP element-mobilizing transposase RayT
MKPGVFTQLYIHLVFAVHDRQCLLKNKEQRKEVYRYISGIVTTMKNKSIIINGMPDHIHIFFGLHPTLSISNIVGEIKRSSSLFINDKKWFVGKFTWQEGYGAFSYSRSQIDKVYKYIQNQHLHHKKRTFEEEYIELLEKFGIEYDKKFLFRFIFDPK